MSRLISIVTVYFPNKHHLENIIEFAKQSDLIIICDNSSANNEVMFSSVSNAIYIYNNANCGLSKAFNIALSLKKINWQNSDKVIFFDQDSSISSNHIGKLQEIYDALKNKNVNLACIGPVFFNNSSNSIEIPKMHKNIDENNMIVDSLITSSMLTEYSCLKEIGFWNENLFLDSADWDLSWRMRQNGYLCVMTKATVLNHTVGEGEKNFGLFKLRIGSPIREYYQTRDCFYSLKQSYTPFKFKIRFLLRLTVRPVLHILFLNEKKKRFAYILRGVSDYMLGKTGAIN